MSARGDERIIFAERAKRSEGVGFRILYCSYRILHRVLTGQSVRVGNFSAIPWQRLESLVTVSELWNHYAAAVFKSRQPIDMIRTERARRLHGTSRMNLTALIVHGLSALSVHGETIGVRLLLMSAFMLFAGFMGLLSVIAVRFLTDWAIPGWATTAAGILTVVVLQSIFFCITFSLFVLSARNQASFSPVQDARQFVGRVVTMYGVESKPLKKTGIG
jgi:hypothetical protein